MPKIILVASMGRQAGQVSPAKDFFLSPWFRRARAYAESSGQVWFILTATHGLLDPEEEVSPFSASFYAMDTTERKTWAMEVAAELRKFLQPGDTVEILAGPAYWQFLLDPLADVGAQVSVLVQGMEIGEQLRFSEVGSTRGDASGSLKFQPEVKI